MGGFDLLVEFLEAFELRREAAFGGGVDDEDDFVLQGGEGVGLAFFCWGGGGVSGWGAVGNGGSVEMGGVVEMGGDELRGYATYYQEA